VASAWLAGSAGATHVTAANVNVQNPVQQDFCGKIREIKPVEIVREYGERNQR
jgi:hypothetical protein